MEQNKKYDFQDLLDILKQLRSENGCPWDKVQTHKSIRNNFLEETYEVLEAIDTNDVNLLREELGDVLLQVVFHAQIEDELGNFNTNDVINELCEKLIIRHPHVFGSVLANDTETVLSNWDAIKQETKGQTTFSETLESVPVTFPALMKAQKVQKRAAKAGFAYDDVFEAFSDLKSEVNELEVEIKNNNSQNCAEELGDLIFSCVNVARYLGVDAEEITEKACEKFMARFKCCEELATQKGEPLDLLSKQELDKLWKQSKKMTLCQK